MGKIKGKIVSNNVFYILVIFFAVVLLIIMVMGGYLYRFYYQTIHEDFMSGNAQYLTAVSERHENDMRIMDNIVHQISLSDGETMFKLEEQPQKAIKLKEHLQRYTTVSESFDLLMYYYHEDSYLYNYLTSISLNSFWKNGCCFEDVTKADFMKLLTDTGIEFRILPEQEVGGDWIINYLSSNKTTVFFRTVYPEQKETLIFMIPDAYYDELLVKDNSALRKDFLYYDTDVIVSRGLEGIEGAQLQELMSAEDISELQIGTVAQKTLHIHRESYLLSVKKGESGIVYGTLQSMDVFHDKVVHEQWGIIFIVLLCFIPAVLIIGVSSGRVMRKVKSLNFLLNSEEVDYDLNNIENGIQTLVMSYRESEKENLPLKKTRFIRDFIRGSFGERTEVLEAAAKAGLQVDYKHFLVVLIRNREINNENKAHAFMLDTIEKEEIGGYGIHLINNNQNLFVLFADEKRAIEEALEKMLVIERAYCTEYIIAISNYHEDFSESSKAYLEAETAFDNYLLTDNSKIIRFMEVSQKEYRNLMTENYLQRLRYAIRTSDKIAVEVAVKDICNRMSGENASLYTFRLLYNDIIHVLLSEWSGNKSEIENFYNVFSLSQCLNIKDFNDMLCDVCEMIIDNRDGKESKNSKVVEKAVKYMQENFADPDLTMNALAEHLEVSPVTLAVEFKNEMDVRPSDYLANLRMEKAKELLAGSNMLIREISRSVGYEDDHVFMRRFKKYTGMTPGQYRKEE